MENKEKDTSLMQDKHLADALFGKEVLLQYNEHQKPLTTTFFENQQMRILNKVAKQKKPIFILGNFKNLAIAACLLATIAATYIYIQTYTTRTTVNQIVRLEEIPSAEIEDYINSNEFIAEIDWSTEALNVPEIFDLNNNTIKQKDTNYKN